MNRCTDADIITRQYRSAVYLKGIHMTAIKVMNVHKHSTSNCNSRFTATHGEERRLGGGGGAQHQSGSTTQLNHRQQCVG